MSAQDSPADLTRALLDPSGTFDSPEELLKSLALSKDRKVEILCLWAYDAAELAVAEEEGMGGGEISQLDAVMSALDGLAGGYDSERVAPTKHRGFCFSAKPAGGGAAA